MATSHVPTLGRSPRGAFTHAGAVAAILVLALLLGAGLLVLQATRGGEATTPDDQPVTAPMEPPKSTASQQIQPGPTFYLVGSQAQADMVQRGIADSDAVLSSLGQASLPMYVMLITSAEEETTFWLDITEQDTIRGGFGLPMLTVVDLRPPLPAGN